MNSLSHSRLPLQEMSGQSWCLLLMWFLARCLFFVGDWLMAFIVLLNSAYVELLLLFVLYITSSSRSIRVSLSARAAHWGFLTIRWWKIRTLHAGCPGRRLEGSAPGPQLHFSGDLSQIRNVTTNHVPDLMENKALVLQVLSWRGNRVWDAEMGGSVLQVMYERTIISECTC